MPQVAKIFHPPYELGVHTGNAPALCQPGFDALFFRIRRTVSSEMLSTSPSSTKRSARSCIVQHLRPSGGVLLLKAISSTSSLLSSLGFAPGRRRSFSANSRFPSTKRLRVRCTVDSLVCNALAISGSDLPSSAKSRMWARFSFRALVCPFLTSSKRWSLSPSFNSTMYTVLLMVASFSQRISQKATLSNPMW